ncbi:uncharacterized protein Z518_02805 [Rhinocladiella mackenziei CBS 650.93]|uniref:Uncharacterized protein n=1 Tax=Rhinocladiella mackenziei CBS 650.93 TaxID=1442369 RepID=A0A0D2IQE7_9EURO|nr:uncharacterized protein Z518_02805 [Rhinocladiella mackenziei CBS 650.93]KIX08149.1 hypothetical protein Z518_02805 [Rhinocladiella mackenziei CBS 650.93]
MTSLIFGSIYLGHKGIVHHRREKQRQKNYERWEGLRDEYDEQRKISRESRSLDIQRTGPDYNRDVEIDRPILTLRDQQEANDARTSWRPQESWDLPADNRRASVEVTAGTGLRPVMNHKTGSTWDEGMPQPLRVSRRNWDDYQPANLSGNVSRSGSLRNPSGANTPRDRSASNTPSLNKKPSPRPDVASPTSTSHPHPSRSVSVPTPLVQHEYIEPIEYETPGGRMAELIEMGDSQRPTPFPQQMPPSYAGFQPSHYGSSTIATQQKSDGMEEWWNRP